MNQVLNNLNKGYHLRNDIIRKQVATLSVMDFIEINRVRGPGHVTRNDILEMTSSGSKWEQYQWWILLKDIEPDGLVM